MKNHIEGLRFRSLCLRALLLAVSATLLVWPLQAASDSSDENASYVALGDSVAFAFDPLLPPGAADNFIGYPEIIEAAKHVQHVSKAINIACPGETSGSFLSTSVPDNGCHDYKAYVGLHTVYSGTQLSYAASLLRSDKHIDLVTINLGGNDMRLLQAGCNYQAACIIAGLQPVLTAYGENLTAIFQGLRVDAGFQGNIVLVTYYSPDYQDPLQTGAMYALNAVATQVAGAFGVLIADGFAAFAQASASSGGRPCAAGLLVQLPDGSCDVHPSPAGRALLADAVLTLIGKNRK